MSGEQTRGNDDRLRDHYSSDHQVFGHVLTLTHAGGVATGDGRVGNNKIDNIYTNSTPNKKCIGPNVS